ncbi:uncharacterized protein [Blastocystis hominis]|uniref:Uncharacterized protein n=1 Tax=Blastocystis hominis TaxID=12968 RepID=D8LZE0_BLAHO|nr:uncharacterized protein [Blastocystis hominis]CBK21179.2 unnamed protein product [Blastocystis hominis]|eukprot:XP_012895227.1 uncharacterized protein [Blastocystis hominis]
MPYARRNLRKKGPKVSLKQKNYIKFRKGAFGSQAIRKVWDNKKTIRQNYERLGLCTDVNAVKREEASNIKPVIVCSSGSCEEGESSDEYV